MHASFDRWICHRKMNPTELATIESACNLRNHISKKCEKWRADTNIISVYEVKMRTKVKKRICDSFLLIFVFEEAILTNIYCKSFYYNS